MLYKAWGMVVKFFDDYFSLLSGAKLKAIHGEGLKILTPKPMLQRLPIALAQVKASNTLQTY